MLGLLVDFVLRFVGGANISPVGSFSVLIVAVMEMFGSKPQWRAGPPKQFAALCGLMFSFLATLFWFCSKVGGMHMLGMARHACWCGCVYVCLYVCVCLPVTHLHSLE